MTSELSSANTVSEPAFGDLHDISPRGQSDGGRQNRRSLDPRMSASGPGCVETQKNSGPSKIGLSKRALRRFLGVGNGNTTPNILRFGVITQPGAKADAQSQGMSSPVRCHTDAMIGCQTSPWMATPISQTAHPP